MRFGRFVKNGRPVKLCVFGHLPGLLFSLFSFFSRVLPPVSNKKIPRIVLGPFFHLKSRRHPSFFFLNQSPTEIVSGDRHGGEITFSLPPSFPPASVPYEEAVELSAKRGLFGLRGTLSPFPLFFFPFFPPPPPPRGVAIAHRY